MGTVARILAMVFVLPFISAWGLMITSGILHAHFLSQVEPVGYGTCLVVSYLGSLVGLLVVGFSINIISLALGSIFVLPFISAWFLMIIAGIVHAQFFSLWQPVGYGPCLALSYLACFIGLIVGSINGGATLIDALANERL